MAKRYGYKTSATRHKPGTGKFTEGKTEVAQISKGNPMYKVTDLASMKKRSRAHPSEEQVKKLRKKRKDQLKGPLQQS